MMTLSGRFLRPGGDPRTLPDYTALCGEMNKLAHPARPDVNWLLAETRCLSLFRHNGADLQTAAWYTLARTQRGGLTGMNEGLALLSSLINRHWPALWPLQAHARMSVLGALSRRLQQHLRTLTPGYADLPALYQAEGHLDTLGDALRRLELQHQAGLLPLRELVHLAAVRLEAVADVSATPADAALLQRDKASAAPETPISGRRPALLRDTAVTSPPRQPVMPVLKPFLAGVLVTVVTLTLVLWATHPRTDRAEGRLMAPLAQLPASLTDSELQSLRQKGLPDSHMRDVWFSRARAQMDRLAALSPVWSQAYAGALVRQAQALWPATPETAALDRRWTQTLNAAALPPEDINGWQQGMTQLQALADRLNGLDPKKGEYMTVSELKTQVFAITQALSRTVPAEEYLRRLAQHPGPSASAAALRTQAERHLAQLQARYALLAQMATAYPEATVPPQVPSAKGGQDGL
ncbi:VasL domain-containing protein [Erwinia typographi]|uniref:VasL domain-containing protein n=1 Tax=Erwinia typographi TaxID=371042 RepID=UPI0009FEBAE8|nr:VasL domain-containing protein [Erwinia typographi]